MAEFEHLKAPYSFKEFYSIYPEGYSIYEALLDWVNQVNEMTTVLNLTLSEWEKVKLWVNSELKTYSEEKLIEWLNDGTLEQIINQTLFDDLQNQVNLKASNVDLNTSIKKSKIYGNSYVRALKTKINAKQPICISVIGDSTGNEKSEWVFKTTQWLASQIPSYQVLYKQWDHNTSLYTTETVQEGTGYYADGVQLNGNLNTYISTPHSSNHNISNEIDIRIKLSLKSFEKDQCLISKFGDSGNRGYALSINATGRPYFWFSNNGTDNETMISEQALELSENTPFWLRAIFNADSGYGSHTVSFYTSNDGLSYTLLGPAVVSSGVTTLYHSTAPIEIFSRGGGSSDVAQGTFYQATIHRGFNGTVIASPNAETKFNPFTDEQGNVFTIHGNYLLNLNEQLIIQNGSSAGMNINYSKNPVILSKQLETPTDLVLISYCHNEGSNINYTDTYVNFCEQIKTLYPNTEIVCVTQNPQIQPELNIKAHAIRNTQISLASALNNYALIDVFSAFLETDDYTALMLDGAHPNSLGQQLWTELVIDFLKPMIE